MYIYQVLENISSFISTSSFCLVPNLFFIQFNMIEDEMSLLNMV